MKNSWLSYLIYISIIFLLFALYKANYLFLPKLLKPEYFLISIILLFSGFICNSLAWKGMLKKNKFSITVTDSIASIGLSIFGKYIPGKIWAIIGRSGYIANKYSYPAKDIAILSLDTQILTLWTGILLGSIGLFAVGGLKKWGSIVLITWFILTMAVFSRYFHRLAGNLYKIVTKKVIEFPHIAFKDILSILPLFFLQWLLWSTGFYFLSASLLNNLPDPNAGLGFALATSLGIAVIFSPGGLGVREAFLIGYLMLSGLDVQNAATVSITSRLWFLIGEVFTFSIAIIAHKKSGLEGNKPQRK